MDRIEQDVEPTLYDVVGVASTASNEEIEASFSKRMTQIRCWFDQNKDPIIYNSEIKTDVQKLSEFIQAHDTLSDPIQRRNYDLRLQEQQQEEERQRVRQEQTEEELQEQEQEEPTYRFCVLNGMICVPCKYQIKEGGIRSLWYRMGNHEHKVHKMLSDLEDRQDNVREYQIDMDRKIETVASLIVSGRLEDARSTFFGYIEGEEQDYRYCGTCDALSVNGTKHNKHQLNPIIYKRGIKSEYCARNKPIIIPIEDFSFDNPKYMSKYFFEELHKRLAMHNRPNINTILTVNSNTNNHQNPHPHHHHYYDYQTNGKNASHDFDSDESSDDDQKKPPAKKSNIKITKLHANSNNSKKTPSCYDIDGGSDDDQKKPPAKKSYIEITKLQTNTPRCHDIDESSDDVQQKPPVKKSNVKITKRRVTKCYKTINSTKFHYVYHDDYSSDDNEKKPLAKTIIQTTLPYIETQNETKRSPDDDDDDNDDKENNMNIYNSTHE
jgi:ribosomal protein L34E